MAGGGHHTTQPFRPAEGRAPGAGLLRLQGGTRPRGGKAAAAPPPYKRSAPPAGGAPHGKRPREATSAGPTSTGNKGCSYKNPGQAARLAAKRAAPPPPEEEPAKPTCAFHNKPGGCRRGDTCTFTHV
eukprot:gene4089-4423_t